MRLLLYHLKTGGDAMINRAADDIARKAKTPAPNGRPKRTCNSGLTPGGPVMYVEVTSREKPFASRAMMRACIPSTVPTPTFHHRNAFNLLSVPSSVII